jgi:hypothetical protein
MAMRKVTPYAAVVVLVIVVVSAFGSLRAAPNKTSAEVTIVPSQPFAAGGSGVTQDAQFALDEFTVPAGKRLVVETVTLRAIVPVGEVTSCGMSVEPALGGPVVTHNFVVTPQGAAPSAFDNFLSNTPVRFYFQPGDELNWFCYRNGNGFVSFAWSVSGYLVDVS